MVHRDRYKVEVTFQPSVLAVNQTAPDANRFGECFRILLRWQGSIYKLAWKQMLIYFALFYMLTLVRDFLLDEDEQRIFDAVGSYCTRYARSLNLVIMLGFFTTTAMQRLFTIQSMIPGTSKLTSFYINALKPNLPEGPILVEKFARWTVLSWLLTFRIVSKPLRELYPDMISLQRAGIINAKERVVLEKVETDHNNDKTPRPLLVIDWMLLLARETNIKGRFSEKSNHLKLVEQILAFKKSCGYIIKFSTQNIPHALIQAAIIIVYTFGLLTLMNRGLVEKERHSVTQGIISYFPLVPSLQFFIFLTWLNFGRAAVNPFGTDETDIDVRSLLDSHIQDSFRLVRTYNKSLEDYFPNLPQRQLNLTSSES